MSVLHLLLRTTLESAGIAPRASRLVELGLKVKVNGNGSGNELGNPDLCRHLNLT